MKQCSYCGKEYPDDTTVCVLDRYPLDQPGGSVEANADEGASVEPPPLANNKYLVYPDYRWSARDAWKFVGMFVIFQVLSMIVMHGMHRQLPHLYSWTLVSGPGFLLRRLAYAAIPILTAAYFARTESFASFWKAMALDRKPTNYVWFGVAAALAIRLGTHVIYALKWAQPTYVNYGLDAFENTRGFEKYFYLLPALLAAFFEEPTYRGFLYKAFRGSYSTGASMALVVAFTAYTHWNQYSISGLTVIALSALTLAQCYLREKSDSLWDCIICHLVFNATNPVIAHFFS